MQTCKELGLSTKGTNKGICLLFYGPSGTGYCHSYNYVNTAIVLLCCVGKTMTANAVASYLKKKILLVTVSLLLDKEISKVSVRVIFYVTCHSLSIGDAAFSI